MVQWLRSLRRPVVATPARMSAVTGACYFSGALLAFTLTLFHASGHIAAQRSLALLAFVTGVVITVAPGRRSWPYHALNVLGTVLITVMMVLTGGGTSAEALSVLYVFVTLQSFFFFTWELGLAFHLVAVTGIVMDVLVFGVLSAPVAIGLVFTQTAAGWVVGWLVRAAGDAEIDAVTGLQNRRGLDRMLTTELANAGRSGTPFSLAVLDLDHFKAVNDAEGHGAGDRLLRMAADCWSRLLPAGATLARQGGDEFALLLPGHGLAEAVAVTESLRLDLEERGHACSAGVAAYAHGMSNSTLSSRADIALYQAKRNGRSRTCEFTAGDSDDELRSALADGQLSVHFQTVFDLAGRRPVSAEALLRWKHPERGYIPPDQFIPVAEASGLICELGRFVLREAAGTAATWSSSVRVAVNVAGAELLQPGYVDQVIDILAAAGLPAHRLILEVTETSIGADSETSLQTLAALRDEGVRVAVDDFGVGYSSLSRLDRLPVDILKLDRTFTSAIPADGGEAPLVAAVAALASAVRLQTVAEGVEEEHQARLLERYGFGMGQGYLFSRPVPAAQLTFDLPAVPAPRRVPGSRATRPSVRVH